MDFTRGTPYGWAGTGAVLKPVPLRISGLARWYRADMGITIGTGVSAWADQSGSGNSNGTLTQGTGSKQPTYNTTDAAFGGKPTLTFTAASFQRMATAAWGTAVPQPCTVFIVGLCTSFPYFNFTDGIVAGTRCIVRAAGAANRAGAYAGLANIDAATTLTTTARVVCVSFNGAASTIHVTSKGTAEVTANPGSQGFTGLVIGSDYNDTAQYLPGKMAEIAIYSRVLDATERGLFMDYAAARYGITVTA